jgi:hypothetical protein
MMESAAGIGTILLIILIGGGVVAVVRAVVRSALRAGNLASVLSGVIKKADLEAQTTPKSLSSAEPLRLDRIRLGAPIQIRREGGPFLLYSCVRGAASVQLPLAGGQTLDFALRAGETMLVPAECLEFTLVPTERDTVLLESTVIRADADPYINPAAEATLPEDA